MHYKYSFNIKHQLENRKLVYTQALRLTIQMINDYVTGPCWSLPLKKVLNFIVVYKCFYLSLQIH